MIGFQDVWFTSDTHFDHANIIKYSRPEFKDVSAEEMSEVLIDKWNKKVKSNDLIFHLGDVFICKSKRSEEIASRLNGRIILIKGNHDAFSDTKYRKMGMNPFIYYQFEEFFLSHKPFNVTSLREANHIGAIHCNIHGHTHEQVDELSPYLHFNVCVENHKYEPIHLEEIRYWIKCNDRPYYQKFDLR